MKSNLLPVFLFLQLFFCACSNNADQKAESKSENDVDAARNFIQSALKSDYAKAKTFLLQDSTNLQYFDVNERRFSRLSPEEKRNYRESSINIHSVRSLNDSATIIIFSNSYKKDHDTLKVLRVNGQWLVDFKYLFEHDSDTTNIDMLNKPDSTK